MKQEQTAVDVVVVTALQVEFDVFCESVKQKVAGGPGVSSWKDQDLHMSSPHVLGTYSTGDGQSLNIAVVRPTRMGGTSTAPAAASLVERLKPRCLSMSGVCAGNPDDVSLGDVIIAEMTYAYDEGKKTAKGFEPSHLHILMEESWVRSAQDLVSTELPSYGKPTERDASFWFLECLYRGRNPMKHPARNRYFPTGTWKTRVQALVKKGFVEQLGVGFKITPTGANRVEQSLAYDIDPPKHLPFAIKVGPMASGNVVVKDGITWQQLSIMGVRSCIGLEMEAATIAHIARNLHVPSWVVAKGVMDHADPEKDDRYKPFAARASSEVLMMFLVRQLCPRAPESAVGIPSLPRAPIGSNSAQGSPFNVPSLPPQYIPRRRDLDRVIEQILPSEHAGLGMLRSCALHGIGGAGKSTIAKAVCFDQRVRAAFPDGVLWAELGLAPNHLSNIKVWLGLLGDDRIPPSNASEAKERLRAGLQYKSVLIVLDNVWKDEDTEPYCISGGTFALLITTRQAEVADKLHIRTEPISVMLPDDAIDLFEAWIKRPIVGTDRIQALALAEVVGYLPLALELAGAVVARGASWSIAHNLFLVELEATRNLSDLSNQMQTILTCLNMSLTRTRVDHDRAWRCFVSLGVLARGAELRDDICAKLWNMSQPSALALLNSLSERAIIQVNLDHFRLHDLMHDLARILLHFKQPFGLAQDQAAVHTQLLNAFGEDIGSLDWEQVNVSYIHSHLVWHLISGGQFRHLDALLHRTSTDGSNYWQNVLRKRDLSELLSRDILAAYQVAREKNESFQRLLPYTLMLSSLRSMEKRLTIPLVTVLMRHGVMSGSHCLAWALARPSSDEVAEALTMVSEVCRALGDQIDVSVRTQALPLAYGRVRNIANDRSGIRAGLALRLFRIAEDSLKRDIRNIFLSSISKFAEVWPNNATNLIAGMPLDEQEYTLGLVLAQVSETSQRNDVAMAICKRSGNLPEPQRRIWVNFLLVWLREACTRPDAGNTPHATALGAIYASIIDFAEASNLELIREVGQSLSTNHVRQVLETTLSRGTYIDRVFHRSISDEDSDIAGIIITLFAEFSEAQREVLISRVEEAWRSKFGFHDTPSLLNSATRSMLTKIAELANVVSNGRLSGLVAEIAVKAEAWGPDEDAFLAPLLVHLNDEQRRKSINRIIAHFSLHQRRESQDEIFIALSNLVTSEDLFRLSGRLKIDDSEEQIRVIFRVAAEVDESSILEGLASQERNSARIRMLARMMRDLTGEFDSVALKEFIDAAASFSSEWWVVEALTVVGKRISTATSLIKLIEAAAHIRQDDLRRRLGGRITAELGMKGHRNEALFQASRIEAGGDKSRVLADLSIQFASMGDYALAQDLLPIIGDHPEKWRAEAHVALYLGVGDPEGARTIAQAITSKKWRDWVVERLTVGYAPAPKQPVQLTPVAARSLDSVDMESIIDPLRRRARYSSVDAPSWADFVALLEDTQKLWSRTTWEHVWKATGGTGRSILECMGNYPRHIALQALAELIPIAARCGCTGDLEGITAAIDDVVGWWP